MAVERELMRSLRLLVFPAAAEAAHRRSLRGGARLPRLMWEADLPSRQADRARRMRCAAKPPLGAAQTGCSAPLDQLGRQGWLRVDDWGLNTAALRAEAEAALRLHAQTPGRGGREPTAAPPATVVVHDAALPALEPLLRNASVAAMLRGYLGADVRYDGSAVLLLRQHVTLESYVSGHWHQDRCGRRLKLFVFLHDIGDAGRPTCVASGSHRQFYYQLGPPPKLLSRYSDAWVRATYGGGGGGGGGDGDDGIVCLTGRAGGGFAFDTNALHRGEVNGRHERLTVILEFHAHRKLPPLVGMQVTNPCPSNPNLNATQRRHGTPGYPLYPQELDARASGRGD